MNDIEHVNRRSVQSLTNFKVPDSKYSDPNEHLLKVIFSRWLFVLLTFLLVLSMGIPLIWYFVKPFYKATGAIRVMPVISSILFGGDEGIPMYRNFMNTQADLITSDEILQRVADDLVEMDAEFFGNVKEPDFIRKMISGLSDPRMDDPIVILRAAINNDSLSILPEENTELIKINMKSHDREKAEAIVNAFIRAYMAIVVTDEARDEDHKLTVLENERKVLGEKLERQRQAIREMAQEYGTSSLTSRQEMMLGRVASLQAKLTEFEMEKIALFVRSQLVQNETAKPIEPREVLRLRYDFTNADLMVRTLTTNIAQLEQSLISAKQELAPTNPQLKRKEKLLEMLNQRLEKQKKQVSRKFDEMMVEELEKSDQVQSEDIKSQLKRITAYETHLTEMLAGEDNETIELGRKQLAIQDMQDQLNITKDIYETVRRRIQELEMERKRPARVSEAYYANTAPYQDKRIKYTAALSFGGFALGVLLALIREKYDLSLKTPTDVVNSSGVPIIGTTTSPQGITKALMPKQTISDYQTICANIELFSGKDIPARLVVTSPSPKDGKSTLAINISKSLAKTGKNVLLIDGDLRKPDIAKLMNLSQQHDGIKKLIMTNNLNEAIFSIGREGFDVLTTCSHQPFEIYKLIKHKRMNDLLNQLSQKYDHIIIDSPPVLAVSDALLWAKISDGVLLTTFAGRTEARDLVETLSRLSRIKVKVFGTVLNNVRVNNSYNAYGYGYCVSDVNAKNRNQKVGAVAS